MNNDYILIALAAVASTLLLCWFFFNKERQGKDAEIRKHIATTHELEKQVHHREREFLDERNQLEVAKSDAVRLARTSGFEEGRLLGQAEKQRDHLIELTHQHSEFLFHGSAQLLK